jgi:LPXTG-motif cell wall-anchored protein
VKLKLTTNQKYILAGVSVLTLALIILARRKKKMSDFTVKGGYTVPQGTPNMGDALHSFERRKSDGFGGKMSTILKEKLLEAYKSGMNPIVKDLKVNVDSKNYKVDWEATIGPSPDGKAYIGMTTFGSAGSNADSRATNQFDSVKKRVNGEDYKLVLDFKNPKGLYIRQFFYAYTKPTEYPPNK